MKVNNLVAFCLSVPMVYLLACTKENVPGSTMVNSSSVNNAVAMSPCDSFAYSDTIFYPEEMENDYKVKPLYKRPGTYGAFPKGLRINKLNGNIDITESETGLKYMVWYVPYGSLDTCKKFITVSGINYPDSIYTLNTQSSVTMAPVYNANPLLLADCTGGCEFDDGHDDDDGDGYADEPPIGEEVIPQGIAIDKSTGVVNLKKSFKNGALGVAPPNGTFKNFTLYYRIGDKSSKTLNEIGFRLFYYRSKADIPADLLKEMGIKKSLVLLNTNDDPFKVAYTVPAITNSIVAQNGAGETKCRPPYIIITTAN